MEKQQVEEWLHTIRANPADWSLREVYADALQEAGDARGEFIALQLRGSDEDRARALFREHGSAWLGPELAKALTRVSFRGGFLDRAALAARSALDAEGWRRACVDPRLATLSRIDRGGGDLGLYTAFVASEAMLGLRDVQVAAPAVLDALLSPGSTRRIEVLRFVGELPSGARLARIAKSPVFDGLAEVGIGVLSTARVADQLRRAVQALRRHGLVRVDRIQLHPSTPNQDGVLGLAGLVELELESLRYGPEDNWIAVDRVDQGLRLTAFGPGCMALPAAVALLGEQVCAARIVAGSLPPGPALVEAVIRDQILAARPDIAWGC